MAATQVVLKLALKYWPTVVTVITALIAFLKDHPNLPAWVQKRITLVLQQLADAQKKRGEAAKIRAMLQIARKTADDLRSRQPDQFAGQASEWVAQADKIELSIDLAETQPKAERKETLSRLRKQTDVLVASVLNALTGVRALPASHKNEHD